MNENIINNEQNLSIKSRLVNFYEKNKFLVYLTLISIIVLIIFSFFYIKNKENEQMLLAENYIDAKIFLENGEENKAKKKLKDIIMANDSTYSTLALFLLLNENLTVDQKETSELFDYILKNNKFEKELENLIIFKKPLIQSNIINQTEMLKVISPLTSSDSIWKSHALLLLGDYFFSKNQYLKGKEFYTKVLSLKNLHNSIYDYAQSQLILINNE